MLHKISSNKVVIYTVTAEDGTIKTYNASISGYIMKFSFEEWKTVGTDPAKHEEPLPSEVLASSVQGHLYWVSLVGLEDFLLKRLMMLRMGNMQSNWLL